MWYHKIKIIISHKSIIISNKKSVPVPKALQTQVTKVRGRLEKRDKTEEDLKILTKSTIPKISLHFPSPYASYFQHTLCKKKYSSLDHFGAKFCSILLTSTELKIWKRMRNLAVSSVIFLMGSSFLLTFLTQIPVLEMFLNKHIWASEKALHFNPY